MLKYEKFRYALQYRPFSMRRRDSRDEASQPINKVCRYNSQFFLNHP
jgi:hypothetical protein